MPSPRISHEECNLDTNRSKMLTVPTISAPPFLGSIFGNSTKTGNEQDK